MAFVTGSASSIAELLTAIQNACTSNGWTLAGNVLYKGTCYVSLDVSGTTIRIIGGRGIDGSNALTSPSDRGYGYLGVALDGSGSPPATPGFPFPITYFIHINTGPDEVYVVVNYAVTYYQLIGWGQSQMSGLNGTGNWYSGSDGKTTAGGITPAGAYSYNNVGGISSLFCRLFEGNGEGVDHSLDSTTWATDDGGSGPATGQDWYAIYANQPSQWNGEAVLIPIRVYASRPSGYWSPVLECTHARHIHIQNLSDQQVITLGPDRWKVYPWWVRGTTFGLGRAGQSNDSYYAGHALRYDGP